MKNENKIVELLAETLRKQDKQEELLQMHATLLQNQGKLLQNQGKILEGHTVLLERLVESQEGLRSDFHKMNDHLLTRIDQTDERIKRLEDRDAKDR